MLSSSSAETADRRSRFQDGYLVCWHRGNRNRRWRPDRDGKLFHVNEDCRIESVRNNKPRCPSFRLLLNRREAARSFSSQVYTGEDVRALVTASYTDQADRFLRLNHLLRAVIFFAVPEVFIKCLADRSDTAFFKQCACKMGTGDDSVFISVN